MMKDIIHLSYIKKTRISPCLKCMFSSQSSGYFSRFIYFRSKPRHRCSTSLMCNMRWCEDTP